MKYRLGETFDFACSYAWLSTYHHASIKSLLYSGSRAVIKPVQNSWGGKFNIYPAVPRGRQIAYGYFSVSEKKITCILIIKALSNIIC